MIKIKKFNINMIETNKSIVNLILNSKEKIHVNEMILDFSETLIGTNYSWNDLIDICNKKKVKINFHLNAQENYNGKKNVLFNRFGGKVPNNILCDLYLKNKPEIKFDEKCIAHQKTVWTPGILLIGGFANGEGRTSVYPDHIARHKMVWRDFSIVCSCNNEMDKYFSILRKNYMIKPELPLMNQYSLPNEKEIICNIIEKSKKYIYIEIQYFMDYDLENVIIKRLKKAIKNKENFRIFIVIHTCHIYEMKQKDIRSGIYSVDRIRKSAKNIEKYLFCGELMYDDYKTIIHSKMVIIDDKILTLSASNWIANNLIKGGNIELGIIFRDDPKISKIMNRIANENLNSNNEIFNYMLHFEKAKNNEGRYRKLNDNLKSFISEILPTKFIEKQFAKRYIAKNLKEIKNIKYYDSDSE